MQCPQTVFKDSKGLSIQLLSDVKVTHGPLGLIDESEAVGQSLPDQGEVGVLLGLQSTHRFGCSSIHCNEDVTSTLGRSLPVIADADPFKALSITLTFRRCDGGQYHLFNDFFAVLMRRR